MRNHQKPTFKWFQCVQAVVLETGRWLVTSCINQRNALVGYILSQKWVKVKTQALFGWHMNKTIRTQELLPRSAMHHRGQAHDTLPNHQLITRQEKACHNKGKNNF